MMLDENVAAVSPSSVYRILSEAGRLDRSPKGNSSKGTGIVEPLKPHEHWHVDVAYLNIAGTFYYLCSVLDGCITQAQNNIKFQSQRRIELWDVRNN